METFIFMQTRVFCNEIQIHIEKKSYTCFSLENAEVDQRKAVISQDWKTPKAAGEEIPLRELHWR